MVLPRTFDPEFPEWAQQDLNLRLPPCEDGTLPLSYAPNAEQAISMR